MLLRRTLLDRREALLGARRGRRREGKMTGALGVVVVVVDEAGLGIDIVRVLGGALLAGGVGGRGLEVGEALHPAGKGPLARMSVRGPRGSLSGGHVAVWWPGGWWLSGAGTEVQGGGAGLDFDTMLRNWTLI